MTPVLEGAEQQALPAPTASLGRCAERAPARNQIIDKQAIGNPHEGTNRQGNIIAV